MENVRSVKPALPARLLHGGDYNPDQWLDCPEVLEEDIAPSEPEKNSQSRFFGRRKANEEKT